MYVVYKKHILFMIKEVPFQNVDKGNVFFFSQIGGLFSIIRNVLLTLLINSVVRCQKVNKDS